nr:putative F-box/LRR-repeat protein At3g18150 [Quercus suber]
MSRVDRWINLVLESEVEELALSFRWSNIPYRLPHSVLVAKSLCVLTLRKCKLVSTCGEGDINLPPLKRFSLSNVYADDQSIQNLIVGCPVIEYMRISGCGGIKSIKFFRVHTVKEIMVGNNFDIGRLELEASNLHSLYINECKLQCNLNLLPFKNLKNLSLNTPNVTEKWLEEHLSGLPLLENLNLFSCSKLKRINLSSHHHLKSLELIFCANLVELMIDNPKLCRLSYWGKTAISFSLNALGLLEAEYMLWSR